VSPVLSTLFGERSWAGAPRARRLAQSLARTRRARSRRHSCCTRSMRAAPHPLLDGGCLAPILLSYTPSAPPLCGRSVSASPTHPAPWLPAFVAAASTLSPPSTGRQAAARHHGGAAVRACARPRVVHGRGGRGHRRGRGRRAVVGRMWADKGGDGHGRTRCHGCRPPATASTVDGRGAARPKQPAPRRPPQRSVAREALGESWGRQRGVVDIPRRMRGEGCPSDAV